MGVPLPFCCPLPYGFGPSCGLPFPVAYSDEGVIYLYGVIGLAGVMVVFLTGWLDLPYSPDKVVILGYLLLLLLRTYRIFMSLVD